VTCGPVATTFRVLDHDASWQLDLTPSGGIAIGDVIELAPLDPTAVDPGFLAAAMPPPWLAHGCGPCDWYLLCPRPPRLLRYGPRLIEPCQEEPSDPCAAPAAPDVSCLGWQPIAGADFRIVLIEPVAVAATSGLVAVLDAGRHELLILSAGGERVIASFPSAARGPIAFGSAAVWVASGAELTRYDLTTLAATALPTAPGPIARLAVAPGTVWAALQTQELDRAGALDLYRLDSAGWQPGQLIELLAQLPRSGVIASSDEAVCLEIPRGGAEPRTLCIDRCGRPSARPPAAPATARARTGSIAALPPIDSGIPRCVFHRLRIELELPEGTGLALKLASSETSADVVAEHDWQVIPDIARLTSPSTGLASCDVLIDQPPGRFLRLELTLRGNGTATPRIQRIRVDFPRSTSAARLPGVYREDPISADFLERFVALFDASIEDLDRVISRFPALLDPSSTPAEALAWLGSFLDIALDPSWAEATRRAILSAAPELYRRRGTPFALARAVQLATGVTPALLELGASAPFARTGAFELGSSRLFGRARTRFTLGSSALGSSPLRSYGDPDRDHVAAVALRVSVQVPALRSADDAERLRRLVESQKPAHVLATVRVGSERALLGSASAVGIDTRLAGLPLPRLGVNTRLRRMTALARGSARGGVGMQLGLSSAVGFQTVLS
jgi:phage tail-like protein